MKREQHKIELKRRVLNLSRELFLKKGFTKTTINEITKGVGITTGSLYHFFKGKEDILMHLTEEVFQGAVLFADAMVGKSGDPKLRFSMEIGIQLYLVRKYKSIAELFLAAHQSADIARMIVQSARSRFEQLFRSGVPDFTPEDYHVAALAVKGILYSFIQETVHPPDNESPAQIFRGVEMALLVFRIPADQIEETVRETRELIQKSSFQLYGFKMP